MCDATFFNLLDTRYIDCIDNYTNSEYVTRFNALFLRASKVMYITSIYRIRVHINK